MSNQIIIFTLDGCYYCMKLKSELDDLLIPYMEIEVTVNPQIWNQVVKQTGHDSLPTVFIKKENTDTGPVYIPGRDFENQEEIIEIIKTHHKGD